jgi:outer membrane lipoprotein SlyB
MALVVVLALAMTLGLSGCETVRENPKTAIGAGAGAAGGAVVGGLIGRGTTGVVVGGLLGALAGGAIGQYLDRQDRSRDQAIEDTDDTQAQGNVVRVDQGRLPRP